ncbi:MAG: hypothetical protein KDA59_18175 [Planctomycetales bacterium]|nr:hypothetical protein [Planctomycetales bacterium]
MDIRISSDRSVDVTNITVSGCSSLSKSLGGFAPANGAVTVNSDGSFSYSPNPLFVGTDSFVYQATNGSDSDTATATIEVCNTAPNVSASSEGMVHDQTFASSVYASDIDGDSITYGVGRVALFLIGRVGNTHRATGVSPVLSCRLLGACGVSNVSANQSSEVIERHGFTVPK